FAGSCRYRGRSNVSSGPAVHPSGVVPVIRCRRPNLARRVGAGCAHLDVVEKCEPLPDVVALIEYDCERRDRPPWQHCERRGSDASVRVNLPTGRGLRVGSRHFLAPDKDSLSDASPEVHSDIEAGSARATMAVVADVEPESDQLRNG